MAEPRGARMVELVEAAVSRKDTGLLRATMEASLHPKMMANRELRLLIMEVMDKKDREEREEVTRDDD